MIENTRALLIILLSFFLAGCDQYQPTRKSKDEVKQGFYHVCQGEGKSYLECEHLYVELGYEP